MTLKPKNAQDASEHIVKLLNPGVPYPMQSTGAQSVLAYMKLRDEATATALLTALEGEKEIACTKGGFGHQHSPFGCGEKLCEFCKHHEDNVCEQKHKGKSFTDIMEYNQALDQAKAIVTKLLTPTV